MMVGCWASLVTSVFLVTVIFVPATSGMMWSSLAGVSSRCWAVTTTGATWAAWARASAGVSDWACASPADTAVAAAAASHATLTLLFPTASPRDPSASVIEGGIG